MPITKSVVGTRCRINCVDIDAARERKTPVAMQHRDEPVEVADEDGIVDAEFRPQRQAHFGRNVRIGRQLAERIARRQRKQHEKNEADAQQAGESDEQASEKVVSHRSPTLPVQALRIITITCGSHASRYQLASCQRSLSQPLDARLRLPFRAVTRGR